MANYTLLETVYEHLSRDSWESNCLVQLNMSNYDWKSGLVDGSGIHVEGLSTNTWGIDFNTCQKYCSGGKTSFEENFDFQRFAGGTTNFLLPWLALTAQLPFETGSPFDNSMAACMAIGSPILITYSLTLTLLNRFWVRRTFGGMRDRAVRSDSEQMKSLATRISAIQTLLEESQQVPLRANSQDGSLETLIRNEDHVHWWDSLKDQLKSSRRGYSASLVAQMFVATIAYLFTVISSFNTQLGDIGTGTQIASGSVWLWLVPVVLGWIIVGTQYRHDSIDHALEAFPIHASSIPPSETDKSPPGITLVSSRRGRQRTFSVPTIDHTTPHTPPPTFLGLSVAGDEQTRGPTYNYARVLTWWQLASTLSHILSSEQHPCPAPAITTSPSDPEPGIVLETRFRAYPEWHIIPAQVWQRVLSATVIAHCLQWAIVGSAIWVGYKTPTVGLGCRSGAYLIYGVVGNLVWLFLTVSAGLSHEVMVKGERGNQAGFGWKVGAVGLRVAGKGLAVGNCFWLVGSSLMEIMGALDNCWCKGAGFSLGSKTWVTIFKTADDLGVSARLSWGGGLALGLLTVISFLLFALTCNTSPSDD